MSNSNQNTSTSENETEKQFIKTIDDVLLLRMAEEELMREAKLGAAKASEIGPQGWIKCPLPKTNKRFLHNTLRNAVTSNKYKDRTSYMKSNNTKVKASERSIKYSNEIIRTDKERRMK